MTPSSFTKIDSQIPPSLFRKFSTLELGTGSGDNINSKKGHSGMASTHSSRKKRLIIMFILTFMYMIAELGVGYFAGSISLIADSFHMLSDVISLIVAFISILLSPKKWKKSTFGWARAEVLGALINSVFLIALCFSIIMESIERFLDPDIKPIKDAKLVLGCGAGGLLVNLIGLFIFREGHGHSHHHHPIQHQGRLTRLVVPEEHGGLDSGVATPATNSPPGTPTTQHEPAVAGLGIGQVTPTGSTTPLITEQSLSKKLPVSQENDNGAKKKDESIQIPEPPKEVHAANKEKKHSHQLNMHGVFLHLLADTLGSIVVIISAAIIWLTDEQRKLHPDKYKLVLYVDPALSVIMVVLITCSAWPLLQETSMILLQTVPTYINMADLKRRLQQTVPGILGIHEFHVWQLAGDCVIASIHIVCKNVDEYIRISRDAKDFFHTNGIHSTTIQAEFLEYDNAKSVFDDKECFLNCPKDENHTVSCATSTCCGVAVNHDNTQ